MSSCDIEMTKLESVKKLPDTSNNDMSNDGFDTLDDFCYDFSSEDDLVDDCTFDEAILNDISSIIADSLLLATVQLLLN